MTHSIPRSGSVRGHRRFGRAVSGVTALALVMAGPVLAVPPAQAAAPVLAATSAAPRAAAAPSAAAPAAGAATAAQPNAATTSTVASNGPVGWDIYRHLDRIDAVTSGSQTHQFSSFDRSGGNTEDGFDGKYSCLRTDAAGCVIAETQGAGEIESIWFTPDEGDVRRTGKIHVERDGRTVLDASLQDVVDGKLGAPFVFPFVANADQSSGGVQIKVPMPYRSSMRVTTDVNPLFYHVTYRTFANTVGVNTFDPSDTASDVIAASAKWGKSDPKPAAGRARTATKNFTLAQGASVKLADVFGPGELSELKVKLPQIVGPKKLPVIVDDGRATKTSTQFSLTIDPANQGVKLTRRWDANSADEVADIYVDGAKVGQWEAIDDVRGYWSYQTVTLPASATAGKSRITVRNVFISASIDWNEFHYWADSVVGGADQRTDELDVGTSDAARASEQAHDYVIVGETWNGTPRQTDKPTDTQSPAILAGNELLRNVYVRVSFDGKRTVEAPLGEFFGSGLMEKPVNALFFAIDPDGWYSSWWPMPFAVRATVELVNRSSKTVTSGSASVTSRPDADVISDLLRGSIGYFNATHQRADTVANQDWDFLETTGRGRFVGVAQTVRGHASTGNIRNYLEGDERVYVDGARTSQIHGTGTEDFYESGWYFNRGEFSNPFVGATAMPTGVYGCENQCDSPYRLMIGEAVSFNDQLTFDIEPGSASLDDAEYSSTAFWYGGTTPSARITDTLDLGDAKSVAAHRYSGTETVTALTGTFEGENDASPVTDLVGVRSAPVSFRLAVDRANTAVTLRRLSDQRVGYQQAKVSVDGTAVGTWQQPLANTTSAWLEDSFQLPSSATRGKRTITVTLTPTGENGWTAAQYQAISLGLFPRPDRQAPSTPIGATAIGADSNAIDLAWTSSVDDVAIAGYQVFASRTAGFKPSAANLVGTAGVASFRHSALGLAETWYYRIRALDTSGNTSALSPQLTARSGSRIRIEGESLLPAVSATAPVEIQGNCCGVNWSGGAQLWFRAAKQGDTATVKFSVPSAGTYAAVMTQTRAADFGIVQVAVDGVDAGAPADNYAATGVSTIDRGLGALTLTAGEHTITLTSVGRNASAVSYLIGFDVLTLTRQDVSEANITSYSSTATVVAAGARQRIYDASVGESGPWYVNDHTFVKGPDGQWNLFGITHAEPADPLNENLFGHATATSLTQAQYAKQPGVIQAQSSLGEKHVWAPYVLKSGSTYYMYYAAGLDENHSTHQMRLATSTDLKTWTKRPQALFTDGYDARDPMVLRVGNQWVMYYTANSTPTGGNHQVAYRTSADLITWSAKKVAFQHPTVGTFGGPTESPFVVAKDGAYYLFICCDANYTDTRVYKSADPLHFDVSQLVGQIDEHAAEVVQDDDGQWYVSGAGWGEGGVYLRPLNFGATRVTAGKVVTTANYRMNVQTSPSASIVSMDVATGTGAWRPVLDADYRGTAPYLAVGAFGNTDVAGAAGTVTVDGSTIRLADIPLGDEPVTADWTIDAGSAGVTTSVTAKVMGATTAPAWEVSMTFDGVGARTGDDVNPNRAVGDIQGFGRWSQSTSNTASFAAACQSGSAFGADNRYVAGSGALIWQPLWAPGGRALPTGTYQVGTWRFGASPIGNDDTLGARLAS
ncbi:MAG: DUF2961 domain-containing protein [Nakamurella sp.]